MSIHVLTLGMHESYYDFPLNDLLLTDCSALGEGLNIYAFPDAISLSRFRFINMRLTNYIDAAAASFPYHRMRSIWAPKPYAARRSPPNASASIDLLQYPTKETAC